MINSQRVSKPLSAWFRKTIIPFATPASNRSEARLQVTARVLWPKSYDIQCYDRFVSVKKENPANTLDLRVLADELKAAALNMHLDPVGSFLFVNFPDEHSRETYSSTAVIFPDGALVTWYMRSDEEKALATNLAGMRVQFANSRVDKEIRESEQFDSFDCTESLPVTVSNAASGTCLLADDTVSLTGLESDRSNEMLAVSMAMGAAARMNAIESTLSAYIKNGHADISSSLSKMNQWKLAKVSESVFQSENAVHRWRYFLTSIHRPAVPDSLWEYEQLDNLFDRIAIRFDLEERFEDLQNQLSYYSDFLRTVGDYVRHGYSSRLEKIIILIIAIEAGIATRHLIVDLF